MELIERIDEMLKVVPKDNRLHSVLVDNRSSVAYCPPWNQGLWIKEISDNLATLIGSPTEQWQTTVRDIWLAPPTATPEGEKCQADGCEQPAKVHECKMCYDSRLIFHKQPEERAKKRLGKMTIIDMLELERYVKSLHKGGTMRSGINATHFDDADGNPAGGTTFGRGFAIGWQNGPLGRGEDRKDPNGAFVEDVIAAAKDRLEYYQGSQFNCEQNAVALRHLDAASLMLSSALEVLDSRTKDREVRDVEGTHEK